MANAIESCRRKIANFISRIVTFTHDNFNGIVPDRTRTTDVVEATTASSVGAIAATKDASDNKAAVLDRACCSNKLSSLASEQSTVSSSVSPPVSPSEASFANCARCSPWYFLAAAMVLRRGSKDLDFQHLVRRTLGGSCATMSGFVNVLVMLGASVARQ